MSAHFVPKRSEYAEIVTFRRAMRHECELVNDFAMRLRKLATHCKFGDQLEKEIERQFVVGCNMDEVQRKCARTDDLTLARVIEYAIGFERLSHNLNDLKQAQTTRVGAIQSSGYRKSTNASRFSNSRQTETAASANTPCGYCGKNAHEDIRQCPARGKECSHCGRTNHFASVCRSRKNNDVRDPKSFNPALDERAKSNWREKSSKTISSIATKPHRDSSSETQSSEREQSNNWRHTSSKAIRSIAPKPHRDSSTETQSSERERISISKDEYAEFIRFKQSQAFGLNRVCEQHCSPETARTVPREGPRANVLVHGEKITFSVDTGSTINVIDETTWSAIKSKPTLDRCNTRYYGYTAERPIATMGQFISNITFKEETRRAAFIVVHGKHECLLSYHTAKDLGVIAMLSRIKMRGQDEDKHTPASKLTAMQPMPLSSKLNCITNSDLKTKQDLNPNIKSLEQSLRPIAIHLKATDEKELHKQVQKDQVKHNVKKASRSIEVQHTQDPRRKHWNRKPCPNQARARKKKPIPTWDSNPHKVTRINASLVTKTRTHQARHETVFNSSRPTRYVEPIQFM